MLTGHKDTPLAVFFAGMSTVASFVIDVSPGGPMLGDSVDDPSEDVWSWCLPRLGRHQDLPSLRAMVESGK